MFVQLAVVFFYFLAREVVKDVPHMCGDEAVGMQTVPTLYGTKKTCQCAIMLVGIAIAINIGYLISKIAMADTVATIIAAAMLINFWCVALWRFYRYLASPTQESVNRFLQYSGAALLLGITGFFL